MITRVMAPLRHSPALKNTVIVLLALALHACGGGGGGGGGSSGKSAPIVVASTVGLGAASSGNVYTARAGSEVLLTGKDSEGTDAPILSFSWRQISPTAADQQVALTERTTSSKVFVAPNVATETTYVFELTGTDANGKSSKQQVSVKVESILDSNLFLIQPGEKEQLNILVKRTATCSGNSCANAVPFTLVLSQVTTWGDRIDPNVQRGPYALPLKTIANRQIDANQQSVVISIPLPKLIIDDINRTLETGGLRDQRIELDRINTINAALEFALTPGTAENISLDLVKNDKTTPLAAATSTLHDPAAASASFSIAYDLTDIRDKYGLTSPTSGSAYYTAIDPTSKYTKLSDWLFDAGFTDASGKLKTDPSITKAIYVNNYDLGFGREMYLRKGANGSVYSFVVNYPTLENTIQGSGAFAVVAMEYSGYPNNAATPGGCANSKFVKFYAFVPDQANGGFVRTATMNFDERGEKAVPGVCSSCHGGTLNVTDFSGNDSITHCGKADIGATFMPWDLDSLLYTDTDPSLNKTKITDAQYNLYTRAAQQNQFRALNEGALATYIDNPTRYDASIRLIHGWYGEKDQDNGTAATYGAVGSLPAVNFDGTYVQSGWRSQTALYQNVYARNCRGCHTQMDPSNNKTFALYEDTSGTNAHPESFMSHVTQLVPYVYQDGIMPLARLTMDRFWVPFAGGTSAAELLRAHLTSKGVTATGTPGLPIARFTTTPSGTKYLDSLISLDASTSLFADTYLWSVSPNSGLALSNNQAPTVAATPSLTGTYSVQLTINGPFGSSSVTQPVVITNRLPVAPNFIATIPDGNTSISINLANYSAFTSAGGSLGDGLGAPSGSAIWTSSSAGAETLGVVNNVLTYANSGSATTDISSPFNYSITDRNGDTAAGTITIQRSSTAPSNLTVTDHHPTSVSLSWTAATSVQVTGYRIYRTVASVESPVTDVSAGTTTYTDSGRATNTNYSYRVASLSSGSPLQYSNSVAVKTQVSYLTDIEPNYDSNSVNWPCVGCHGARVGNSDTHLFNPAKLPDCLKASTSCDGSTSPGAGAMFGQFNASSPAYLLLKTWYDDYGQSPVNTE